MINLGELEEQVGKVVNHVHEYSELEPFNSKATIQEWYEAKQFFINAFGGLIYEVPGITKFELSPKTKDDNMKQFIDEIATNYRYMEVYDLINFLARNGSEGFYSNRVMEDYEYNGKIIHKGTRLIKSFAYFLNNELTLDAIQTSASRIIQETKVEGHLCLSVHPLDYLSSSENNAKWRSCHSLDGEYRGGNLSYMVDRSTIVCYLKADDDGQKLPNFPSDVQWNSKKWRMLLFASDQHNAFYAGRQYPFDINGILDRILDVLFQKLNYSKDSWTPWRNHYVHTIAMPDGEEYTLAKEYVPMSSILVERKDLITNGEGSLQYNDLLASTYYKKPFYTHRRYGTPNTHFTIGGKCSCPHCGNNPVESSHVLICEECLSKLPGYTKCMCCGKHYLQTDMTYLESYDDYVCETCYDDEIEICDSCGQAFLSEDVHRTSYGTYCTDCYEDNDY